MGGGRSRVYGDPSGTAPTDGTTLAVALPVASRDGGVVSPRDVPPLGRSPLTSAVVAAVTVDVATTTGLRGGVWGAGSDGTAAPAAASPNATTSPARCTDVRSFTTAPIRPWAPLPSSSSSSSSSPSLVWALTCTTSPSSRLWAWLRLWLWL